MIASFGNLDIRQMPGRSQHTRRGFVVEIIGQIGDGAIPLVAREASSSLAGVALSSGSWPSVRFRIGCLRTRSNNLKGRKILTCAGYRLHQSSAGNNFLPLAGSDNGIYFGNIFLNFIAVAL